MSTYPNRIREQRVRSRLSLKELGQLVSLSTSMVSLHERGLRRLSLSEIEAYANVFKVTTVEILLDVPEEVTS